jgi:predicted nucleotidyltransferase
MVLVAVLFNLSMTITEIKNEVQILLNEVRKWAESRPEILGVALVGSYARNEARADSDVDFVLLASVPQEFINKPEWINNFGVVKSCTVEDWGLVTSLRVYYEGGPEVEYGLTSSEWASEPVDEGTSQVFSDGMQILLDKAGLLLGMPHYTEVDRSS